MATFKHISSKNADYGAAEQYLTFEHDEFTMKPTLDENGLAVLEEVCPLSARMVVNPVSMKMEQERISKLITDLRQVMSEGEK